MDHNKTIIIRGTPSEFFEPQEGTRERRQTSHLHSSPSPARDQLELSEIWAVLRRSIRRILLLGLLVFALVMTFTLQSGMTFESNGRLYLGELAHSKTSSAPTQEFDLTEDMQSDLPSEIEILQSHSLIKRAILRSGLNVEISREGATPLNYFEWRRSGRNLEQLQKGAQELLAVESSLPDEFKEPRTYQVQMLTDTRFELFEHGRKLVAGRLGEALYLQEGVHLSLLAGDVHKPQPGVRYEIEIYPMETMLKTTLEDLSVSAPETKALEQAKVVTLTFSHASPFMAARFLKTLMQSYLEERQSWKTENATAAGTFATEQLAEMRDSLNRIEDELSAFRKTNQVIAIEEGAQALVHQLSQHEASRIASRLEVDSLKHLQSVLNNPHSDIESFMVGEAIDKDRVLENLAGSLAASQVRLGELNSIYREAAPEVKDQRAKVNAHLDSIRTYVDGRLNRAQVQLDGLNGVVSQYEGRLKAVPGAELRMARLSRESEVYSEMYTYLLERQQQASMIKASDVSKNRILDSPQVISEESSPKLALRLASAPLGLSIGALLVLASTFFGGKLHSETEVKRIAGGLPILARVPKSGHKKGAPELDRREKGAATFGFIEAVRTLRTNLHYLNRTTNGTVVLFASPSPGDGKTTCAIALASVLAADDKRVLLVDADLRKPSHHLLLEADENILATTFDNPKAWSRGAVPVTGSFGTFHSLRVDDDSDADLCSDSEMSKFLAQVCSIYDYVLFDCAAYPLVSDTLMLAGYGDLVVSVLRLHKTKRQHAVDHLQGLAGTGAMQAVIVNDSESFGAYGRISYGNRPVLTRKNPKSDAKEERSYFDQAPS